MSEAPGWDRRDRASEAPGWDRRDRANEAPGWDRRGRWTLRFADADLERAYQEETCDPIRRRRQRAVFIDAPLWAVVGILGPPIIGVDPGPFLAVAAVMVLVVAASAFIAGRTRTRSGLDLNSAVAAAVASVAILVLAAATDTFDRFAALALAAVGVQVVTAYRLSFMVAVLIASVQLIVFTAAGLSFATALPLQVLLLGVTLAFVCWGTYISEGRERRVFAQRRLIADLHRRVDALFHQYLSPDVAETLLADPDRAELGGEVVEVTVMFADLRGFTPFSEKTPPHTVVDMLNAAFSAAVPVVFGEGGTIVQFAGDSLMAIFNAPVRQPDHALRAARASLGLQRAVATIPGAADRPVFRVGLSSGPALVGNIGSAEVRNFTAIGDTTNLAARLQTFAEPGGIVMGQRTYELIRDVALVRPLGTPPLKGKSTPTPVYELLGLRDSRMPARPTLRGRCVSPTSARPTPR